MYPRDWDHSCADGQPFACRRFVQEPCPTRLNYRRLQRFFQYIVLDPDATAKLIINMLNYTRPRYLALDRTHWKIGSRDVNILVLALVTRRFRVPLMWTVLEHAGNSDCARRIALMDRYLRLFGASSVKLLMADREFIGAEWMEYL